MGFSGSGLGLWSQGEGRPTSLLFFINSLFAQILSAYYMSSAVLPGGRKSKSLLLWYLCIPASRSTKGTTEGYIFIIINSQWNENTIWEYGFYNTKELNIEQCLSLVVLLRFFYILHWWLFISYLVFHSTNAYCTFTICWINYSSDQVTYISSILWSCPNQFLNVNTPHKQNQGKHKSKCCYLVFKV